MSLAAAVVFSIPAATAEQRSIDTAASAITVRVYRAGVFSPLGHNHEIVAPIGRGMVDTDAGRIVLSVSASTLAVRDRDISDKDRNQIQSTMLGPEVLDAQRFPDITFRSTAVRPAGADAWRVEGELTLHGQTHPVLLEVRQSNGHYMGSSRFKQTDFGITPVKVAGGTIKVKDDVQIDFDVVLAR